MWAAAYLRALLVLITSFSAASASECNVELKPSDGYKELSEKLKCLSAKIETASKGADASSIKLVPGVPVLPNACVISSTLPRGSEWIVTANFKLCRPDGSVWFRVTEARPPAEYFYKPGTLDNVGDNGSRYAVSHSEKELLCTVKSPPCVIKDDETSEQFQFQLEVRDFEGADKRSEKRLVGLLSRMTPKKAEEK